MYQFWITFFFPIYSETTTQLTCCMLLPTARILFYLTLECLWSLDMGKPRATCLSMTFWPKVEQTSTSAITKYAVSARPMNIYFFATCIMSVFSHAYPSWFTSIPFVACRHFFVLPAFMPVVWFLTNTWALFLLFFLTALTCNNNFEGGGWALVRRVKKGSVWHPATDGLRGTSVYGIRNSRINDDSVLSISYSTNVWTGTEFLFMIGEVFKIHFCKHFLFCIGAFLFCCLRSSVFSCCEWCFVCVSYHPIQIPSLSMFSLFRFWESLTWCRVMVDMLTRSLLHSCFASSRLRR